MAPLALQIHVERTADPCELRWVTHDPDLVASPSGRRQPAPSSALGRVLAGLPGSPAEVSIVGGAIHVRLADASRWPGSVRAVHDAVADDLAARAEWLHEVDATSPGPSVTMRIPVVESGGCSVGGGTGACRSCPSARR
jgi:hypothetical protein